MQPRSGARIELPTQHQIGSHHTVHVFRLTRQPASTSGPECVISPPDIPASFNLRKERVGSGGESTGFEEDDASSDFHSVVAESFVEPSEQGDVDSSLHSVRPLLGLGDGEQAPVQFVHDRVGGHKLLRVSRIDVPQYYLGFGRPSHCCPSHVRYDCPRFGRYGRRRVAQARDLGDVDGQCAHTLQTCGDVQTANGKSEVMCHRGL